MIDSHIFVSCRHKLCEIACVFYESGELLFFLVHHSAGINILSLLLSSIWRFRTSSEELQLLSKQEVKYFHSGSEMHSSIWKERGGDFFFLVGNSKRPPPLLFGGREIKISRNRAHTHQWRKKKNWRICAQGRSWPPPTTVCPNFSSTFPPPKIPSLFPSWRRGGEHVYLQWVSGCPEKNLVCLCFCVRKERRGGGVAKQFWREKGGRRRTAKHKSWP